MFFALLLVLRCTEEKAPRMIASRAQVARRQTTNRAIAIIQKRRNCDA